MQKPYTVQVHLLEARGLVARKGKESTDSFCVVTIAGRRYQTEIQRNTVNCVWDEVFIFNDIALSDDEFERENIYVHVYEANTFWKNELIGQYTFGMAKVNRQREHRHQFYRTWVVLTDPNDPVEEQGYVKMTVTVLGPGDSPPSHEGAAEQQDDESGDLILRPPTVRRRGYNLNVKVYKAEDLPDMDPVNGLCDPFVSVKFNGLVVRTSTVRRDNKPVWLSHLWLPVFTPCMSDNIDVQVWDWNRGAPDEVIATHRLSFADLLSSSFGPAWVNLYGMPVSEGGLFGWFSELVQRGDVETTAYLGRVLIGASAVMTDDPTMGDRSTPPVKEPRNAEYLLRMDLYGGSDIPIGFRGEVMVEVSFGPSRNTRQSDWVPADAEDGSKFNFSVGRDDPKSADGEKQSEPGMCQFKEIMERLPKCKKTAEDWELAQLYDIVINVYTRGFTGGVTRVGYLRYKPKEVWGWNHKPEWHPIKPVVQTNGVVAAHAGFLLFNIEFGPKHAQPKPPARAPMEKLKPTKHEVRIYLYQARHLPAIKEDDATCPCKVSVSVAGQQAKRVDGKYRLEHDQIGSGHREGTLNPMWYEILKIPEVELNEVLFLAPPIQLSVVSEVDGLVKKETVVGRLEYPTAYCTPDSWAASTGPKWLRLLPESGDPAHNHGDILVRFEVLPSSQAAKHPMEEFAFPNSYLVDVQAAILGLRQLAPTGLFGSVTNPMLELEMPQAVHAYGIDDDDEEDEDDYATPFTVTDIVSWSSTTVDTGDRFTGSSPNLLDTASLEVRVPIRQYAGHAQPLTVRVFEDGVSGRTVVGYLEIPMRGHLESVYGDYAQGEEFVEDAPEFFHRVIEMEAEKDSGAEDGSDISDGGAGKSEDEEDSDGEESKAVPGVGKVPASRRQDKELPLDVLALNMHFEEEVSQVEEDVELENVDLNEQGETEVYWPGDERKDEAVGPRRLVKDNLEGERDFSPLFAEYKLLRGVRGENQTLRTDVGRCKIAFRVKDKNAQSALMDADELQAEAERETEFKKLQGILVALRKPVNIKARVYVIQGHSLIPRGFARKASPYVILQMSGRADMLGEEGKKFFHNDSVNMLTNTLSPEFYKPFEMDACIPDVSALTISVCDGSNLFGAEIGRTQIDLEDRWINEQWQRSSKSRDIPKEFRTLLRADMPGVPQGKLELWVEMYPEDQARDIPFVPIEPPRPQEWELRVVTWQARKVPLVDGGKSVDIYVSCELITAESEKGESLFPTTSKFDTDIHNGSRDGSGTFNYRLLFPVTIPSRMPRLKVQVWDNDLLSSDTFIGEANVDMTAFFREALDDGERVDRGRTWIKMTHPKYRNDPRGEVELQLALVTRKYADKHPVGFARGEPNEDPFLPDVVRPPRFGFGGGGGRGKLYFYLFIFIVVLGGVAYMMM